jgi:hypothetical protein
MSEYTSEAKTLDTPADAVTPSACSEQAGQALPDHLYPLSEQWAVWRTVCLRGAGFPAALVLELADSACAELADQLIEAEAELEQKREEAIAVLRARLELASPDEQNVLKQTLRALRKVQYPQPLALADLPDAEIAAFRAAYERLSTRHVAFPHAFTAATLRSSRALHACARQERFREAVTWQNRQAIHSGIASLLHHTPEQTSQNSKQRSNEMLVANYLQRYAAKTIASASSVR